MRRLKDFHIEFPFMITDCKYLTIRNTCPDENNKMVIKIIFGLKSEQAKLASYKNPSAGDTVEDWVVEAIKDNNDYGKVIITITLDSWGDYNIIYNKFDMITDILSGKSVDKEYKITLNEKNSNTINSSLQITENKIRLEGNINDNVLTPFKIVIDFKEDSDNLKFGIISHCDYVKDYCIEHYYTMIDKEMTWWE